jgi:hypothetical protein
VVYLSWAVGGCQAHPGPPGVFASAPVFNVPSDDLAVILDSIVIPKLVEDLLDSVIVRGGSRAK